jgi:hypothetical protein
VEYSKNRYLFPKETPSFTFCSDIS